MTPLHVAARDANNDKLLELLEKGVDPCIRERGGRTPCPVAMDKGHVMVFIAMWLAIVICGIGTQLQKISYASGIFYHHVIKILFGRLTTPLYLQALNKVARFVHGQVQPGAVAEASFFCTAAVYATPADAVPQLLGPLMDSILSALADTPVTGLSGDGPWAEFKVGRSPGLELSMTYQLNVQAIAVMCGGHALLQYEILLIRVIGAAFDTPLSKMAMDCDTRLWGQCSYSNGLGRRKPAYQFNYEPLEIPSDPGEGTCFKFFIRVVDYLRNEIAQCDETDVGQKHVKILMSLFCCTGLYLSSMDHEGNCMNKIHGFDGEVKSTFNETMADLFAKMLEQIARVRSISAGNHLSAWRGLTIRTGVMSQNFFDDWSGEDLH
ncbi:unnamed protein product [Sphagnum troendelagicum]|uniref:Ankyrin repeat protein n=1 Tax=Sphagnum troendelagicum TaxID=128251 RepID=A0ABP0UWZ2_9BRYO